MELVRMRAVNVSGRLLRLPLSSLSGCSVIVSLHRSQGVFGPVSLPLMAGPFFICSRNRRFTFVHSESQAPIAFSASAIPTPRVAENSCTPMPSRSAP